MEKKVENETEATIYGLGFRGYYPKTGERNGKDNENETDAIASNFFYLLRKTRPSEPFIRPFN